MTETTSSAPAKEPGTAATLFSVAALLASVAFLLMGHGLQQTVLPIRGGIEGFSSVEVGLLGSCYFAGYVAGCVAGPRIIIRAGHIRTFAALVAVASSASLAHAIVVDPIPWMICRAVTGFCLAGLYLVIESWLNERATNRTRGTIMSAYITVNLTVITIGQMIVPLFNPQSFVQLSIASILVSLAAVPVALTRAEQPAPVTLVRFRPRALFRLSPAGVAGTFMVGVANGSFWALGPVYGQQLGLSVAEIAGFMSLAVIGGAVAQYPLGLLSDRMDRRFVMMGISVATILFGTLLSGVIPLDGTASLVVAFLFGAALMPGYTVAAAHVYDRGTPESFVEISAGLLLLNGVGSVIGPLPASAAMEALGPGALFGAVAIAHVLLLAYLVLRRQQREAVAVEDRTVYNAANAAPVMTIGDPGAVEESPLVVDPTEPVPQEIPETLPVDGPDEVSPPAKAEEAGETGAAGEAGTDTPKPPSASS